MSNSPKVERKTKAIMFTDIAGYTKAMSESEQKALEMLRKKRSIIKTLIDNYDGKYVKEIGDGTLSYFESGYNASSCAKELQKQVKAQDLDGKKIKIDATGLLAQALEHEIDHLNGILYLDHLKSHESLRKITDETDTDIEDEEVSAKETTS